MNGKIIETKINRFDGGISIDRREQTSNKFCITKHFDIFSSPKTLIPFRALESNETKVLDIVKFLFVNSNIYGLGVVQGGSVAKIYKKTGDIITGGWVQDTDAEGAGARSEKVFFHYKNYLYFWEAGARLTRHGDITGVATNETYQTLAYTNIAQPVHHPADDCAYFFYDNKVARLNNATWDTGNPVLTLPDNFIITSAVPHGNYLAIGCKDKNAVGNSFVFLWDMDADSWNESIDWGVGELEVLGVIDGFLIGISNVGVHSSLGLLNKIEAKYLSGGQSYSIQLINLDSVSTGDYNYYLTGDCIIKNGKLYFAIESATNDNSTAYTGIWVIGRNRADGSFSITMAYKVDTDATANSDVINGFDIFQDYLFVGHSGDGSVDRTNDQEVYGTGIYESQIFNAGDSSLIKKLRGITVSNKALPEGGQIVLKYLKDEEIDGQDWANATVVFTQTVDDTNDEDYQSISHSAINVESTGATLPEYKEIQFRIESTGGASITGLKFNEEILAKDLYD